MKNEYIVTLKVTFPEYFDECDAFNRFSGHRDYIAEEVSAIEIDVIDVIDAVKN